MSKDQIEKVKRIVRLGHLTQTWRAIVARPQLAKELIRLYPEA